MGVDSLARRLAAAALQKGGVSQDYVDSQLNKKYDKTGGTITGDVAIQGDLTVSGTTTSESQKQLLVEDNVIATNANKVDLKTLLSGLAINKNENATYGIMYDPSDDTVKFGEGTLDADNKFVFKAGEGHPLAIRADSTLFTDAHLVKWDATTMSFVDAGTTIATIQASIDTKRDKITAPHIGEVVYSQKADGAESSIAVSVDSVKNSLPLRDNDCNINANIDCGKPNNRPATLPSYGSANYLQLLRGTPEEWAAYDVPLMDGEVALLKRQNGRVQLRVGNGQNNFSALKNVGDITVKSGALSYGTLEAGVEYRIATIEDGLVEYYFPDTPDEDLYSILVFDAPATAIEFATDEDAKLTGDNCKNGVFTPAPNTHYTIYFWYDGTKQGFVRGVPTDGGTWVSDKPTIGTSTSSTDLKKIVYTADADIPTAPEEGVEYACTDLIGEADLDPTFINKVNSKQNLLTFDTAPTSGSANPVTSGGIYDAISKFLTIQVSDSLIGG